MNIAETLITVEPSPAIAAANEKRVHEIRRRCPFRKRLQTLVREQTGSKFDSMMLERAQMAPMLVGKCVVSEHPLGVIAQACGGF